MIDSAFEDQCLSKSLKDLVFLKKAVKILEAHHFSTPQHSWMWSCIKDVWDKFKELCSAKFVLAKVKRDFKEEDREAYIVLAVKLYKMKPTAAEASLEELSLFVRTANVQVALEKAAKSFEKGKIDDVYEVFRGASKRDSRKTSYTHLPWMEGFEDRQAERKYKREHPEEFISIPTGFKKLDAIIGGVSPGELGLVLGTTGRGKSIILNNIAFNAVIKGYETVLFGFEMPAVQIAMRQDARWLKMSYKKFKDFDFTPEELREIDSRLHRVKKKFESKFHIISMPVRSADLNSIRYALEDLKNDYGFVPKLVIFDSADHLNPLEKTKEHRLNQAEVYWGVKGMAEEEGFGAWSSTHASKEFASKVITAEGAAESYDKARIADLMISVNDPKKKSRATKPVEDDEDWDESKETGGITPEVIARGKYLELYVAKYRDGKSDVTIPMDAMFEKMLIQELGEDDETGLSSEELE